MRVSSIRASSFLLALAAGCGPKLVAPELAPPVAPVAPEAPKTVPLPAFDRSAPKPYAASASEPRLTDLQQLTFGGENAEAYWSFDGRQLIMQVRHGAMGCDRIVRMDVAAGLPSLSPVSSGLGATTCSYFLPGDKEVVYASTHSGGDACPPKPDMSKGYVWALYDTYDIYRANADGTNVHPLTTEKGYDAEATVCAKDGSIIFTSTRDGDIELYRMDADGKNVKRLTNTPGYDGGAFFSSDCTKIVWRASRPKVGPELEDFKKLLAEGLVRPSKLELFVANADGTDPVQVTYLNAASFGPFFTPDSKRIIFSSNYGDPKGREFDLWMVGVDGTNLEQVTKSPGFDGFPMFSPDGKTLIFASNRATAPGASDTNLFLAKWVETPPAPFTTGAAERIRDEVAWLADPARTGRGVGTPGLVQAGERLEKHFQDLGLTPAGDKGFRNPFDVVHELTVEPTTSFVVDGRAAKLEDLAPLGFSAEGKVEAKLLFAGHGVVAPELGIDDYKGLDAKGRIVVVKRFVPDVKELASTDAKRRYGDIRHKAWLAKERGAKALVVVDVPVATSTSAKAPDEAPLPKTEPEGAGDAGILVVAAKQSAFGGELVAKTKAKLVVDLAVKKLEVFNVVGKIPVTGKPLGGPIVIGAHYDHLGLGGRSSLAPDKNEPHLGADDNASGTAALVEIARALVAKKDELRREVYFVAFSAEESGVLGSSHIVKKPPKAFRIKDAIAMLNLDMVGRMRSNQLTILGGESAAEWSELVQPACQAARVSCTTTGDGFGPSDHTPFYAAGTPVLHFFTGSHSDYHKPSDRADRLNAIGTAKTAEITAALALALSKREKGLTYKQVPSPAPRGDLRSYNASLGTIPDYAGLPAGQRGVLLAGVRPGGGADKAGMKRGDILVRLGKHEIGSVSDLMFVLNASKPGETVTGEVLRDGKKVTLEVTFQESTGRR
ncbi:M20/M25/M40 family metallo-hydrolase [Myxococcota bacterium]|nr:M20/M25/M40 family metallo-hydrolase [Myxococcota bacterium]